MYHHTFEKSLELPEVLNFPPVVEPIVRLRTLDGLTSRETLPKGKGKLIVNPKTDTVMGLSKGRHDPKPYSMLWDNLLQGLRDQGFNLDDAEVRWSIIDEGRKIRVELLLKRFSYERILGEPTALCLVWIDSMDGSRSFHIEAHIKRLVCLNGMWGVEETCSVKLRHTNNLDTAAAGKEAAGWPRLLEEDAKFLKYLKFKRVNADDAGNFLTDLSTKLVSVEIPGSVRKKKEYKIERKKERILHDLLDSYSEGGMGNTGYALHNAITHYSSNLGYTEGVNLGLKGRSAVSTRLLNRDDWGRKAIRSDGFKELVDYDEFQRQTA